MYFPRLGYGAMGEERGLKASSECQKKADFRKADG